MTNHVYLAVLVVYILGFPAMYYYSLRRDAKCDLERNPREAFIFALFWPALVLFMVVIIFIEKTIRLAYAARAYFRSKLRGKH